MTKPKAAPRARYTLGFKQEAVRLVEGGQSIAAAARTLGVVDQTLFNWVKAKREGKLAGADSKPVSAEQMEIARLRAELARVTGSGAEAHAAARHSRQGQAALQGHHRQQARPAHCTQPAQPPGGGLGAAPGRQAKDEVVAWVPWYNRSRLHSTRAYVSPMRFEANWLAGQPRQASA